MKKLAAGLIMVVGVGLVVVSSQKGEAPAGSSNGEVSGVTAGAERGRVPASVGSAEGVTAGGGSAGSAPAAKLSAPTLAPAEARAQAHSLNDRVAALQACYNGGCDYPETDARSYAFGVGQDLSHELQRFAAVAKGGDLKSEEIAALARDQLKNDDGHVQEAALALLATQPTSDANLAAVLENVIGGYDAQLIRAALGELSRYTTESAQEKIANALSGAMTAGSPFVAREVSNGITPFLFPRTVPIYEEAVHAIGEGSLVRRDLARAIAAYRGQ